MTDSDLLKGLDDRRGAHLANLLENLQLIADLGYGDVAVAVVATDGALRVVADARPSTAVAPMPSTRVGRTLARADEPEAYEALAEHRRRARSSGYARHAASSSPRAPTRSARREPFAVLVRNLSRRSPRRRARWRRRSCRQPRTSSASVREGPLLDVHSGHGFSTVRTAGDGLLRIDSEGRVSYASPNAVNIVRLAGYDGAIRGASGAELPGGGYGIAPVLGTLKAIEAEVEVADRALRFRTIGLPEGAVVLVQDITEARSRDAELKVKEATIREVHHRVKNNLQTIASLLRIQARRTGSDEAAPRARRGHRARVVDGGRARPARGLGRGARRLRRSDGHGGRARAAGARRRSVGHQRHGRGTLRARRRPYRHLACARGRRARAQRARARLPRARRGRGARAAATRARRTRAGDSRRRPGPARRLRPGRPRRTSDWSSSARSSRTTCAVR